MFVACCDWRYICSGHNKQKHGIKPYKWKYIQLQTCGGQTIKHYIDSIRHRNFQIPQSTNRNVNLIHVLYILLS